MDLPTSLAADRPVVIAGPTASGKSALALRIAQDQGGVIVNADALQVWSCWRALSARPDAQDEAAAPHLLYGHCPPGIDYSVGHWLREAQDIVSAWRSGAGPRPIFVGGTGLYLTALTSGLADIPATPPTIRARADARLQAEGASALLAELDPATTARIDTQNPARIQRAWEVMQTTGKGLAAWQDATPAPLLPLAEITALVLNADRDWLAERIDLRFRHMLDSGAIDEVRAVLSIWDPRALWAQAIGAPELVAYLHDEIPLDQAIELAQAASRQYAKRQRTWFRARMRDWHPLNAQ